VVDEKDPRLIWRGIGRCLDHHYRPDPDSPEPIERLLEALRERDRQNERRSHAG
jgi:hypothetical protein